MDKRLKTRWLKALRSGEYEQGRGKLAVETDSGARFCCLGVLVDITEGFTERDGDLFCDSPAQSAQTKHSLSNRLLDKFGLTRRQQEELINRNDGYCGHKPKTFKKIADYIEENL